MSRTEVFDVDQNGDVHSVGQASNGFGFSMLIWEYIALTSGTPLANMFDLAGLRKIWNLFDSDKLDEPDKFLLGVTFDRAWIHVKHVPTLLEGIDRFDKTFVVPEKRARTTRDVGALIRSHLAFNPDTLGFAFNGTSVGTAMWLDPETNEGINLRTRKTAADGKEHYELGGFTFE